MVLVLSTSCYGWRTAFSLCYFSGSPGAFSKAIFWIGGMLCVVTWFHLERQFWTPQNFTIPVIVTLWGLSLFATPDGAA
nr:hypothetical protein [Escherichia coli]